jgi:hypothetical protein
MKLCQNCRCRKPAPNRARCPKCLVQCAAAQKRRRKARQAKGLCLFCTRPPVAALVCCAVHRDRIAAYRNSPAGKAKRREWRKRSRIKRIIERVYGTSK